MKLTEVMQVERDERVTKFSYEFDGRRGPKEFFSTFRDCSKFDLTAFEDVECSKNCSRTRGDCLSFVRMRPAPPGPLKAIQSLPVFMYSSSISKSTLNSSKNCELCSNVQSGVSGV